MTTYKYICQTCRLIADGYDEHDLGHGLPDTRALEFFGVTSRSEPCGFGVCDFCSADTEVFEVIECIDPPTV